MDKKQHVLTFLSFLSSTYIYLIAAFVIYAVFRNYMSFKDVDFVVNNFNMPLYYFLPEKAEKLQYFALITGFPILYLIFYKIWESVKLNITEKLYKSVVITEITSATILVLFLYKASLNRHNFFFTLINNSLEIIILGAFLFYLLYVYQTGSKKIKIILNTLLGIIMVSAAITIGSIYYTPVYDLSASCRHHFSAYFSPIYKVLSGQVIGINFENIYGFYPYIYELILKPIKNISVSHINMINVFLILSSFLFAATTFALNIRNKIVAFVFMLTYIYYFYIFCILANMETIYYLQFMPHRIFFITFVIFLASIYQKIQNHKARKIMEILCFIFMITALIWNFESGIVAIGGWYGYLIYSEALKFKEQKSSIKKLLTTLFQPLLIALLSFIIIELITILKCGKIIDVDNMFYYQNVFYKTGYFMLPMPLYHQPWILIILIYITAMIKSLNNLFFSHKIDAKSAIYFMLSIIGLGIFVYYQGRSHILILGGVSFPALIIVSLYCDEFLNKFINKNYDKFICCISLIKFILIYTAVSAVAVSSFDMLFLSGFNKQLTLLKQQTLENGSLKRDYDFIKNNTKGKKLDILTADSDLLYSKLEQKDLLPFASTSDWAEKSQYKKVFDYLNQSNNTLIIDEEIFNKLKGNEPKQLIELLNKKQYRLQNMTYNGMNNIFIYEQNNFLNKK